MSQSIPQLDAPGTGLPPVEAFIARHVIFPLKSSLMSPAQAIAELPRLGHALMKLTQSVPAEQLAQQQLIKRFTIPLVVIVFIVV